MTIEDRIYGTATVDSAAIGELISSKPLLRLKGIAQFGIPDEFYYDKGFSRYEHSIGVMLLLKKLGASEEEQVAGLLHDISHTAFSHAIDWVYGDGKTEDYQDEQHKRYISDSEIPAILEKHGFATERVADYHHFGLLERDKPEVCADRVDYSLRQFPESIVSACVPALSSVDGRIVFQNKHAAQLFAATFLTWQTEHWGGFEGVSRYRIFADALRKALHDGTIVEADFWQTDDFVLRKLLTSENKEVQRALQLLRNKSLAHLRKGTVTAHKKFRYVDPLFLERGKLARLSQVSRSFAKQLEEARVVNECGIVVPSIAI